jgi:site-specific recombinase XerD
MTSAALVVIEQPQDTTGRLVEMVCDAVGSRHTKRAYGRHIRAFLTWYAAAGHKRLDAVTVRRYKEVLRAGGTGSQSVNQALSAIRLMAALLEEMGELSSEQARAIEGVKGVKKAGKRLGNWLSKEQAQELINAPDAATLKGKRDRAILGLLIGCGLRRDEAATLTIEQVQVREGRWVVCDLDGKGSKIRNVPMAAWTKALLDAWLEEAGIRSGYLFRPVNKAGRVAGAKASTQTLWNVVGEHSARTGIKVAPHDLRRTYAKLAAKGGAKLEQIQINLGHSNINTTQIYLGNTLDLQDAPCDALGIRFDA